MAVAPEVAGAVHETRTYPFELTVAAVAVKADGF